MHQTIKFHLHLNEETKNIILQRQKDYSFFFRKLYKHINLIEDAVYIDELCKKFNISKYESNCIKKEVKSKFDKVQTQKDKLSQEIVVLDEIIKNLRTKTRTKKETRTLFKLENKLLNELIASLFTENLDLL